jgi:hypothetical protein
MPLLTNVTSSLVFTSNTIQNLSLPSLQQIREDFLIADSGNMNNISALILVAVYRNLNITSLSNVSTISFPRLGLISGTAIFFNGFNQLSLPALTNLGNMTISTTGTLEYNGTAPTSIIVYGSYNCSSGDSTLYLAASGNSTTSLPASSSSASIHLEALAGSGLTTGGEIGVGVGMPVLAAVIAFFVLRLRKAKRA